MYRVTEIIGFFDPAKKFMNSEEACEFGTNIHEICTIEDKYNIPKKEKLLLENLPELLQKYLKGWQNFKSVYHPKFLEIEERHTSTLQFTGQPDRIAKLVTKGRVVKKVLIDIKTGTPAKGAAGLQLAAYASFSDFNIQEAWIINLSEKGYKITHKFNVAELKQYYSIFKSMLSVYSFIQNNFKI